jgi:hypothetical protein
LKSDHLGKVSVGLQSAASDNTAILVDGSGSLVPANWVTFVGDGMYLRQSPGIGAPTIFATEDPVDGDEPFHVWRQKDLAFCNSLGTGVGGDCMGVPFNSVRYDSPTFGGFSVSASWGEDDFWDVAARYAGEWGGIKVAVAGAYSEITDGAGSANLAFGPPPEGHDVSYFQIGGYLEHVPTGLWVYGAWGREETEHGSPVFGYDIPDGDVWYVKAGLRERWTPLGHTVLYGFYGENDDKFNPIILDVIDDPGVSVSSEFINWGFGAVQEIDAAAMSLWIHFQQNEGEMTFSEGALSESIDFEDWQSVKAGALINF